MGKPYQPQSNAAIVLDSIQSLLTHPKTKPSSETLIGKTFMCELPGGQLYFDSVLEVDTDGSVFSAQDPTGAKKDRTGVSPTTVTDASGKYLDADQVNYFVLPKGGFEGRHKIRPGDIAAVIYGSRIAFACYGDRGPANKLGEGSIALHRALGHETVAGGKLINAAKGGVGLPPGVVTIVFPASGNGSGRSSNQSAALGQKLFDQLKGDGYAYEMEILARFRSRQMAIPPEKIDLEFQLLDWMQEVLDNTPHPPNIDAGYLVASAIGVDTLLYAPLPTVGMALPTPSRGPAPGKPSLTMVYADFSQGRTPTGRWYVSQVRFHLNATEQAQAAKAQADASKAALKDRLLQKASMRP